MNTKPKSAEEWLEYDTKNNCLFEFPKLDEEWICEFIKQIQLDAYRAGMMRGAEEASMDTEVKHYESDYSIGRTEARLSIEKLAKQLTEKDLQ